LGLVSSNVQTTTIGATYIPDINPQLVNRVVGSLEYGRALALLSQFLAAASPDEIRVAEQIVSDHDEFTVYTNLSRRIEARPGPLSEQSDRAQDKFARRGIAWIMALARVEVAAMAAGFSPDPEPFAKGRPSPYELAAYREMLEDSMRTHYWSLNRDRTPGTMRRGVTSDQQGIAYVRRTTLALKFLREVRNERQGQLTLVQQTELDTWEQQLRDLQSHLLYNVLGVHDAVISSRSFDNLYLHKCGTTREQILDDIRSGRATVNGASAAAMAELQKELRPPTGVANAHAPAANSSVAGGQANSGQAAPAVVAPTGGAAAAARK
jgi:hypothetical protein